MKSQATRSLGLFLSVLCGLSLGVESRAGESAENLFPEAGIHWVRISPAGDWIAAYAKVGGSYGILVQRTATGETTAVVSMTIPLRRYAWIDRNTLVADFIGDYRRRTIVVRLRATETDTEFDIDWIQPFGWMVDALPLVEEEVVWAVYKDGKQELRRVAIQQLIDEGSGKVRRGLLGTRLALVAGDIRRWIVDRNGNPRAVQRQDEDEITILVREEGKSRFREVYHFNEGDEENSLTLLSLSSDQRQLIVKAYNGNDTLGLFEFDPTTGTFGKPIFHREGTDVGDVLVDPNTRELIAAIYEDAGETRYHYFESYGRNLLASVSEDFPPGSIAIVSSTADRRRFVFWVSGPTDPGAYYYRDSRSGTTTKIAGYGENVDRDALAEVNSFVVKSKDGTEIEAFLTLPRSSRAEAAPLVVMPHGGPYGVRDSKRYSPLVQYLASWGFAVLQPNYRGSEGYGLKFLDSGKKAWALGIEDDIDAAVEYAMALPEIDANRICIYGGSYGGFSAIANIVRHRTRYRCAISLNGVSDIPLMYDSSDFADFERVLASFEKVVGDLETERDKLIETSPAYHVKKIETPIFLIFGTEDRRVDPDHSHRMLLMLETYGKEHDSMEVEGMVHSPTRDEWVEVARAIRRYLTRFLFPSEEFRPDPETG